MNEPIIIPEPTGFAANLERDRQKTIAILADKSDMNSAPTKLANLGWMNSIVQFSKIVNLLGAIVTALEESRSQSAPETWIDSKGVYYRLITENGASYTYLANGEDHTPVEPSRPVIEGSSEYKICLSQPRYTRRIGSEQLEIAKGATRITIQVLDGEITCSNGDGTIPAGVAPLVFVNESGLEGLIINGDRDADYVVTSQYPVVETEELTTPIANIRATVPSTEPVLEPYPSVAGYSADIENIDTTLPMTGDLLPAASDLIQV